MSEQFFRVFLVFLLLLAFAPVSSALGGNWTEENPEAAFPGRYMHSSVVFNDRMWVIGGLNSSAYYNDTWYSSDGKLWSRAVEEAAFPARLSFAAVVFDNKMWVIGGQGPGGWPKQDVWNSSDGITWKEAANTAAFPARFGHSSAVFANKIWVIGGDSGGNTNDVWNSTDGITWNQATSSAGFSGRYGHTSIVYDNKIWVIGGSDGGDKKDVWSSPNGIDWTEVTTSAAFPARYGHASLVYDNKMWVIGGLSSGIILDDAWYSTDGITWSKATVTTPMPAREGHTSLAYGSKMWALGGYDGTVNRNSTWSFQSSPVAGFTANTTSGNYPLAVAFTDTSTGYPSSYSWDFGDGSTSSSSGPVHTYISAGTYAVSLTVTNSDGRNVTTRNIAVTAPGSSPASSGDSSDPVMGPVHSGTPMTVTVNTGGNSAVTRATVTGTGISDLILTGTVEALPPAIPPPPGTVYQYFGLVPARYSTISSAVIAFVIPASWLEEQRIPPDTIVLYHYTGKAWEKLPTSESSRKDGSVTFTAQGSSFSLFAISGVPGGTSPVPVMEGKDSPGSGAVPVSPSAVREPGAMAPLPAASPASAGVTEPGQPPVPGEGIPWLLVAVVAGVVILLAGGIMVRQWWLHSQNPSLFRKQP